MRFNVTGFCLDPMLLGSTSEGKSKRLLRALSTSLKLFDRKSLLLKIFVLFENCHQIITNRCTEKREEKLQTSVPCLCYCFLVEYLALAGLMNFLAQLSDKIHHFTVYNLMPLAFLTKLSKMH